MSRNTRNVPYNQRMLAQIGRGEVRVPLMGTILLNNAYHPGEDVTVSGEIGQCIYAINNLVMKAANTTTNRNQAVAIGLHLKAASDVVIAFAVQREAAGSSGADVKLDPGAMKMPAIQRRRLPLNHTARSGI